MEFSVPAALDGERADRVVALVTGLPRADAAALVADGAVINNGRVVTTRSVRLHAGDHLEFELPAAVVDQAPRGDPSVIFTVRFADDDIIVIDKPAGLVVHPGAGNHEGTLVHGLVARFPDLSAHDWPDPSRPGIVHRLDKGTSGLLVVARTLSAMVSLSTQLQVHTVERRYLTLVWGTVEAPAGVIDAPLGRSDRDPVRMAVRADGRPAVTRYEVLQQFGDPSPVTLLACRLETGRTHQIRVHLAAIGHPVVGDDRYRRRPLVGGRRLAAGPLAAGRPFLHAEGLAFDHPSSGRRRTFHAPLAADLAAVLAELG